MNEINDELIAIYQNPEGNIKVEVRVEKQDVWLSLKQMALVFQRDKSVISRHIKNLFQSEELDINSTVAKHATIQKEGGRDIERSIEFYNLDVILAVGYRVNSIQGVRFRKWATNILKEHLHNGYTINKDHLTEEKLKSLKQTIAILSNSLLSSELTDNTNIIIEYSKAWNLIAAYDEKRLSIPLNLKEEVIVLDYQEALTAISELKAKLKAQGSASELFGMEKAPGISKILELLNQTFDQVPLYKSIEEKAAHLIYFMIKDHLFLDGNKRIGSLLFLLYLKKAGIELNKINVNSITALAILIASSHPEEKDIIIKLIINMLS